MAVERLWIRMSGAIRWLVGMRSLSIPFFGEIMTALILAQGVLIVLTSTSGLEAVGVFRSAQILYSPLNVLLMALTMVGIPEGIRLARSRPERFRATLLAGSAALTLGVIIWSATVVTMPSSWGEQLLGDSWAAASAILGVAGVYYIGSAAQVGPLIGLRTLEASRASFWARSAGGLVGFTLGSLGASLDGARGAFLGLGVGAVLTAVALAIALRIVGRSSPVMSAVPDPPPSPASPG
jgi:O-antigen/teichoic acid export membrane protein